MMQVVQIVQYNDILFDSRLFQLFFFLSFFLFFFLEEL